MGTGIEQRPWTPTVRRGKIAAETSSPGPACVQLPTLVGKKVPDSKKPGAPAFTFGQKHRSNFDSIGPGPAQYDVSGLGMKGKATPPAASLRSRPKDKTLFRTPAPGEYDVDRSAKAVVDATPKYSFGQKPPNEKPNLTPAPNVYKIPTVLGVSKEGPIRSAPAFTMAGRQKPRLIPSLLLPGPGAYDGEYSVMKYKPPMYTMRGKFKYPSDEHNKPGPGAHCPEKYQLYRTSPAPSFSIHHSPFLGQRRAYIIPHLNRVCLVP
uniref:Outer dense fiber protein 3 n=1 Tax=Zeugodacus cucurbitae TaxID=28588 RepID=A0A0A1XJM1_ZEUCU